MTQKMFRLTFTLKTGTVDMGSYGGSGHGAVHVSRLLDFEAANEDAARITALAFIARERYGFSSLEERSLILFGQDKLEFSDPLMLE